MRHHRILTRYHPYQRKKQEFDSKVETRQAPVPLSGKEVGSGGYKSATRKSNNGETISSSSLSSSISSVSDPKGYIWVRARVVPDKDGRLIVLSETTREVVVRMINNLTLLIFQLSTSQLLCC
jgi:hypothetical protein